ncbi:AAA family ATPase [Mycobacterium sp. HNNTM2301]|uniref:AAA family ATPase n=1 Tax=Mycobacterium hainanense TaxID=3289775 RepID=UPI0035A647C5
MTHKENTAKVGNRAGSAGTNGHNGHHVDAGDQADMNGRQPGDEGHNPFDTRAANAKRAEQRAYGSAAAATLVGGLYVAEHGKAKLTDAGYAAVAALEGISADDARAAKLIDRIPSEADVVRWYRERGERTWELPTKASVDRAGLKAATRGLDATRKIAVTTIDARAAEGVSWAQRAIAKAAADNLDMAVKAKVYSFTLTNLHAYGAAVADLVALPAMTPETRLASLRLLRQWAAEENLRAQDEARKRLAVAEVAEVTLPPVVSLDELLADDDEPVRMRIEQVWPSGGGKGSCAAMAGAGKTTLNGNLLRSLVDGDPFLGAFEVHETISRIMVIDLEMTPSMMRRWLRRQGVRNTAAVVDVVNLRSKAHLFDISKDKLRDMWMRRIRDNGIEWVTFDCLKPVLDVMGLNENNEMGKFLTPFDAMLGEAGVSDVLVYHHTGHQNERPRGDSMLLGWTDVNLKLVKPEPGADADRYFAADKVRDADTPAPEGLLSFDKATGRLTYAGGDRSATAASAAVEKRLNEVLNVLADHRVKHPGDDDKGMTQTEIRNAVKGKNETTDEALALAASKDRNLVVLKRQGRANRYWIKPAAMDPLHIDDESTDSDIETGGQPVAGPPGAPTDG